MASRTYSSTSAQSNSLSSQVGMLARRRRSMRHHISPMLRASSAGARVRQTCSRASDGQVDGEGAEPGEALAVDGLEPVRSQEHLLTGGIQIPEHRSEVIPWIAEVCEGPVQHGRDPLFIEQNILRSEVAVEYGDNTRLGAGLPEALKLLDGVARDALGAEFGPAHHLFLQMTLGP